MKTLVITNKNGVKGYSSALHYDSNNNLIIKSTQEESNSLYRNIESDIRWNEFKKNIVSIINNYHRDGMGNWNNIQIKISSEDNSFSCEMNIGNKIKKFEF